MKIMSLPVDDGGCGWYRVRQPFEMIKKFTPHDAHVIDKEKDDMLMVAKALQNTDVMVVRQGGEVGVPFFREKYPHLKWVLDLDDNMEIISPYSQHYGEYGVNDIKHEGKWLWKDGQNLSISKNKAKIRSLTEFMKEVDMVTVTTDKLKEYASQYSKNVVVLPNSIDFSHWWQLPFKENKQMRVGWSGGISHYEDWYSIKKPLNDLMREFQFKLVMVGSDFTGIIDDDNKHLVELHPSWVPFLAHSYRMMCLNLDFAIIPLADLPFNHYKSSIKFYEMSAMGVPSVVSNILPYSDDIKGKAWGYKTPDDFKKCVLGALMKSSNLKYYQKQAKKYVLDNFNAKTNASLWTNAYLSLLDTKKQIV